MSAATVANASYSGFSQPNLSIKKLMDVVWYCRNTLEGRKRHAPRPPRPISVHTFLEVYRE